jgi:hypothetical protein
MKTLLIISGLLTLGQIAGWELTPGDIQAQNEGLARMREAAGELSGNPSNELILKLAAGLRKTAMRNIYSVEGSDEVHQLLRESLLSVPGHAQCIADEVERFRKESEHLGRGNQASYDSKRQVLIDETLRHLPSPETIKVLGNYLYDERDLPPKITFLPENSFLACMALSEVGLRDAPVKSRPGFSSWKESVTKQRAWYAQVKAGILPFSFVGQKVEYRFKPDGTWKTIAMVNPPDDGPRRINAEQPAPARPSKRTIVDRKSTGESESSVRWPWVIGIPVLLIAGAIWLRFKNFTRLRPH